MDLLIKLLIAVFFAAVEFLLKLALIYYGIALVFLGLYWAFIETTAGWYAVAAITLVILLVKAASESSDKTSRQ